MKKVFGLFLMLLMSVGCGRIANDPVISDQANNSDNPNDNDNTNGGTTTPSGPVNLDSNIKSMQIGDTTYSVIYTDTWFYSEQETGFNPNIYVDTFNEDPQFTAEETITLSEGQTEVVFSDSKGDWPPIQVEFYQKAP